MNNLNNNRHHEPALGFSLSDIYFILFRHKRAIVVLTLLGLLAGTGYFFLQQPPYQSGAKLLIKYITETHDETANQKNTQLREAGDQNSGVLLAEAEIMSSFDLFRQVATNVGPEKILAKLGGGKDPVLAAAEIQRHLKVMPGKESGVITVMFTHPDAEMCKPVLAEIIQDYIDLSHNVHAAVGATDESLQEKINSLRLQINQIDDEIRVAKTNAGIVDLAGAKKSNQDEVDRLNREINMMETEVAGQAEPPKKTPVATTSSNPTNTASATAPAAEIARYKNAVSRLAMFSKKEDEYLFVRGYTESNKLVLEVRENIAQVGKIKTELEEKYPALADMVFQPVDLGPTTAAASPAAQSSFSPMRLKKLQSLLGMVQAQAMKLDDAESRINDLTRRKTTLDDSYKLYTTQLEQNQIRNTFGPGQISNIVLVESPTPPTKNLGKYYKVIGGLVFGGLLAGLFWAFLIELYVDRTVKRASEIESKLNIPFFLAIPAIGKSERKLLAAPSRQTEFGGPTAAGGNLVPTANLEVNSALVNHALDSHYDALRDRLVLYFESINLTRKPKLVAVTSAGRGAGVSTIASGLAASLSETGDGRVLLVDMNQENGGAQQFFNGKANCKLDDALLRDKRDEALVQERLYVVSEGSASDKLSRVLPKRFAALVPQLKASDYDYIIFDMPPVSQTSITTRLAGFMDTVMLVIESEKTDRDTVQQANALLTQSKANVTAVLNKTKQHVPGRLVHDINAKV